MLEYLTQSCLFCKHDSCYDNLYEQNFSEQDLSPELFSARRITEHFHYSIVKCKKTGLLFSRKILPESVLQDLYQKSQMNYGCYHHLLQKNYWQPLLKHRAPFITYLDSNQKGKALEIGCGNGFFLEKLLLEEFNEVYGCEPSLAAKSQAVPKVQTQIHSGFFSENVFPEKQFDLICSFQTFDHLMDPVLMLQNCYQKLNPKGLLYLIMHNTDSLQAKIFGEKSPIIDIEHIYLFNPSNLALLLENAGYKVWKTFSITNDYPLEYLISHAPLPGKKWILKAARRLDLDQKVISLPLGNMGIIAQKI